MEILTKKGLSWNTQWYRPVGVCNPGRHWGQALQALAADDVRSWVMGRIERGPSPRATNGEILALSLCFAAAAVPRLDLPSKRSRRKVPRRLGPLPDQGQKGVDEPRPGPPPLPGRAQRQRHRAVVHAEMLRECPGRPSVRDSRRSVFRRNLGARSRGRRTPAAEGGCAPQERIVRRDDTASALPAGTDDRRLTTGGAQ